MTKKYELLLDDTKEFYGHKLYRIRALRDFGNVKKGDLGGYIKKEENLSHFGDAWVTGNAVVTDKAWVTENARVTGKAVVTGKAWVTGNARVTDNAEVTENARVTGKAWVTGNARVTDKAWVTGNARVSGNADYIVFKNNWSSGRYFTYTKSNKMWKVGCFYGTGDELVDKAYKDSQLSGDCYKAYVELVKKLEELQERGS